MARRIDLRRQDTAGSKALHYGVQHRLGRRVLLFGRTSSTVKVSEMSV